MSNRLPDEILFTIFQHLNSNDLRECHLICRSWYPPAHAQILKDVRLRNIRAIESFIAAFRLEHNQRYLKSVKSIRVHPYFYERDNIVLDGLIIVKLFFGFPNLEKVRLGHLNLITNFDEDLCRILLTCCPKLRSFKVDADDEDDRFVTFLRKVRPLLTAISLSGNSQMGATETIQFLTQFPRLRSIKCSNKLVGRLELFLPALEQLSNVAKLCLDLNYDMPKNPGERYMSTRPQKIQDQLIKQLSNITYLAIRASTSIGNVFQFVSEYFTGLKNLDVERVGYDDIANEEQDLFHKNLFGLIPSLDYCFYNLEDMHFTSLVKSFTSLIQNTFQKVPAAHKQSKNRILGISVTDKETISSHIVGMILTTDQAPFSRDISIRVDQELSVMVNLFKNGAPMDQVDVFTLSFPTWRSHRSPPITTHDILPLLEPMPSLKLVNFEVPCWLDQTIAKDDKAYSGPILSSVEEATFDVSRDGAMQTILDTCYFAFPNLKLLSINICSSMWNDSVGEFQLLLQNYSLEKLTLELERVISKTEQPFNKTDVFFVLLEVEIRSLQEKRMYKVSTNFSYDQIMDLGELRNFQRNKDYHPVRVVVNSLKQLQLFRKGYGVKYSCNIILDDK